MEVKNIVTRGNVESLKENWKHDPCWDIEATEGFEEFREELLQFRIETEKMWKDKEASRVSKKCAMLGCSQELLHYIEMLEYKLDNLSNQVIG